MRFKIEKSQNKPNFWVCSDFKNKIVCIFEDKKFNDTQEFSVLEDFNAENFMKLAEYAREMGDWLRENHYNKIFSMNIRFQIGARLTQLRREKNMSQETLAGISGVARRTITNIESGSFAVKIDTLGKLVDALDCKIEITEKII